MNITLQQLKSCMPLIKDATIAANLDALNKTMTAYEINTPLRIAHFLAQIAHESSNLNVVEENLNYTAASLLKVFGKYFNNLEEAKKVERNPIAIANIVYAKRLGNGDTASGDGYKYRGRGAIQNTGKVNYALLTIALGMDFVKNPDLLKLPQYSLMAAGQYWKSRNLNVLADKDDILNITKKINGGTNGIDERTINLRRCKAVLGVI